MSSFLPKTYREAGFSPEEIQRIESSSMQAESGNLIPEATVWENFKDKTRAFV